jgi:hypothetical protein
MEGGMIRDGFVEIEMCVKSQLESPYRNCLDGGEKRKNDPRSQPLRVIGWV